MSNTDADKAKNALASLVPESAAKNYDQMARDIAASKGTTPKAAMAELVKQWKVMADRGEDGYDSLAAWGEGRDPGDGAEPNTEAYELARAIESAKREPKLAYQSHPEAVKAATEELERRGERGTAAEVDPESGVIPNSGPVEVTGNELAKKKK
jgi:hypothetical protein